jgi:hypothetical protein
MGIDYKMGKMQSVKVDEQVTPLGGIQVHLQPVPFLITLSITEVGGFETLTCPPTKNYNSERNNRTGTRPQFWLYCVIGRLFLSK